jgi:hypothetical protein
MPRCTNSWLHAAQTIPGAGPTRACTAAPNGPSHLHAPLFQMDERHRLKIGEATIGREQRKHAMPPADLPCMHAGSTNGAGRLASLITDQMKERQRRSFPQPATHASIPRIRAGQIF